MTTCPACGHEFRQQRSTTPDKRARSWRVRVMLFGPGDTLEADTEPDAPPYDPASEAPIVRGLPGVARFIASLATEFHGHTPDDLSVQVLTHKTASLRPTLSRMSGQATWRVPYTIPRTTPGGGAVEESWHMRCEVRREKETET